MFQRIKKKLRWVNPKIRIQRGIGKSKIKFNPVKSNCLRWLWDIKFF